MKTPAGGHRDTQWVIQRRPVKTVEVPGVDVPYEEKLWTRYGTLPTSVEAKAALPYLRHNDPEHEWRAIRVETVQRVEDW